MRIRSKVVLFVLFFAMASGAVMGWCFFNIRREEAAFAANRRAMKTFATITDIEYFLARQVRLLENYVLLGDESERLQLTQTTHQTDQRLKEWETAWKKGEADGVEIPSVRGAHRSISASSQKIQTLLSSGKRVQAMILVEKEFTAISEKALADFAQVKKRGEWNKNETEHLVVEELRRNHLGLMMGLGLVVFFGIGFLWALYRAVIRPITGMRLWADRVARGEKGLPMTAFSGRNELTELAQSIGEMAIQLTRPKVLPPTPPPPPPAPPRVVPSVSAPPPLEKPVSPPSPVPKPMIYPSVPITPPPPPAPAVVLSQQNVPPLAAVPVAVSPAPLPHDEFENAVNEFREIITQMAGREKEKGEIKGKERNRS